MKMQLVNKIVGCMRRVFIRSLLYFAGIALFGMFIRFTPGGKGVFGEYSLNKQKIDPPFLTGSNKWVDSVFSSLSNEDKIAQLFMIAVYPNYNYTHYKEIEYLINPPILYFLIKYSISL